MSRRFVCGIRSFATNGLCVAHRIGSEVEDGWSITNRIWCSFFHRGIEIPRLPPEQRETDFWTQAQTTAETWLTQEAR